MSADKRERFEQVIEGVGTTTKYGPALVLGQEAGDLLSLDIENLGAETTDGFTIDVQLAPGGAWFSYLADGEFDVTTIANMRWATSTGPHELPGSAHAGTQVWLGAVHAVRFGASVAANTTDLKIRGQFGSR